MEAYLRYAHTLERRVRPILDIELYRAILGLPTPWTVLGMDLDVKGRQVMVQVHTGEGAPAAHHLRRGVGGSRRGR